MHAFRTCGSRVVSSSRKWKSGIRGDHCSLYREKFFFKSFQVSRIESFVSFSFLSSHFFFSIIGG